MFRGVVSMNNEREFKEFKDLPEGWKWVRLGEVVIENPKSPFKVEDCDNFGNFPFFTSGDNVLRHSHFLVDEENLFIATGGKAKINYFYGKASYSADTYSLKVKDLNTKYIFYTLLKDIEIIDYKFFSGSGLKHLQKDDFKGLSIPLPPLPEQQKIAEIFETIDNAIEKTDKIIEKYKRIKQGLMQDLLTKGIDENRNIRNEKTHKFKDSPLGRIPEEWEVVRLGEVCDIKISNVDKKIEERGKKVMLCNYLDVYKNDYITKSINFMTGTATKREIDKFNVLKGDVIITKDSEEFDDIAKPSYVAEKIPNLVCGYHLAILRPKNTVDGLFLSKALKLQPINIFFQKRANGMTRFGITKETIENALIPLPPLPEQQRIAEILSQIDQTIEKEQQYKEKLKRIKQGLMEDLLTGKVRVNQLIKEA